MIGKCLVKKGYQLAFIDMDGKLTWQEDGTTFDEADALAVAKVYGGEVIKLDASRHQPLVSGKESDMLSSISDNGLRPAVTIAQFVTNSVGTYTSKEDAENRLLEAYMNGYEVQEYNVYVKGTTDWIYSRSKEGDGVFPVSINMYKPYNILDDEDTHFTEHEIANFELTGLKKTLVEE